MADIVEPVYSNVSLPDGAKLAYQVLGSEHIGCAVPLVLVCGMTSRRNDWDRLSSALSRQRPILLYDHRGMGDSTYSTPSGDDEVSMESLAKDLVFLIGSLKWKEVAICGWSMGGIIVQQLALLPYHPERPVNLPFRISHLILTATLGSPLRPAGAGQPRTGLQIAMDAPPPHTDAQKIAIMKPIAESFFDTEWLADAANQPRRRWWITRYIAKRPMHTIAKQKAATAKFDLGGLHARIPRATRVLVIHGKRDAVVPFSRGEELTRLIPHVILLGIRKDTGYGLPNLDFGHAWWEYFDIQIWNDAIENFLNDVLPGDKRRRAGKAVL
ncbi:hypothetical protein PLICRDRAFT_595483 [Plicaturopsis crispa FD-325 SS-3]|nr:hypothetical protein PLICRDRAFT_595483 [Plicaturopsis crispa FD-325 SS-3]